MGPSDSGPNLCLGMPFRLLTDIALPCSLGQVRLRAPGSDPILSPVGLAMPVVASRAGRRWVSPSSLCVLAVSKSAWGGAIGGPRLGELRSLAWLRARRGDGQVVTAVSSGHQPRPGATATPLDPGRLAPWGQPAGAQAGPVVFPWSLLGGTGAWPLELWRSRPLMPPSSLGPQILFDQAQRSVRQQLHNFVKE